MTRRCSSTLNFNAVRRVFGFGYWSFSAWAKLEGEERGQFHRLVRGRTRRRGQAARRRRRGLRAHPSSDDPRDRRRHLRQHRRFRRILLAGRRARRWPASKSCAGRNSPRRDASASRPRALDAESRRRPKRKQALMRILVATDAWRPQVNGVVHTLERMSAAAREFGGGIRSSSPRRASHRCRCRPIPTSALALASPWRGRRGGSRRRAPTTSISRPKARSAGRRGAIACKRGRLVHHQLPHALSRIYRRAHAASRRR